MEPGDKDMCSGNYRSSEKVWWKHIRRGLPPLKTLYSQCGSRCSSQSLCVKETFIKKNMLQVCYSLKAWISRQHQKIVKKAFFILFPSFCVADPPPQFVMMKCDKLWITEEKTIKEKRKKRLILKCTITTLENLWETLEKPCFLLCIGVFKTNPHDDTVKRKKALADRVLPLTNHLINDGRMAPWTLEIWIVLLGWQTISSTFLVKKKKKQPPLSTWRKLKEFLFYTLFTHHVLSFLVQPWQ